MTNFEIAILLALIGSSIIFDIICAELFSRTRRNRSDIEITNSILDFHNSSINSIDKRMDVLVKMISDHIEDKNKSFPVSIKAKIFEPKISVCPNCKTQDPYFIINAEPNELRCSCVSCGGIIILKNEKNNKIIVKEADT